MLRKLERLIKYLISFFIMRQKQDIYNNEQLLQSSSPQRRREILSILEQYCKTNPWPAIYASMPVTTGIRFYDVLEKYGVKDPSKLKKGVFYSEIFRPNIEEGIEFGRKLSEGLGKSVIVPSKFEPENKWSQDEFMYLWYNIIEKIVGKEYMKSGWEYSNGGAKELVRGSQINYHIEKGILRRNPVSIYNADGYNISTKNGIIMVQNAIISLNKRGFKPDTLERQLDILDSLPLSNCSKSMNN